MGPVGAKLIAMSVLGIGTFVLGLVPLKIASSLRWTRHACERLPVSQIVLSVLLCFGAGVLLATSFIHMLPEVRESIEKSGILAPESNFRLAEVLVCSGFFLVYLLEEVVHAVLYRRLHKHHDHDPHAEHHCPTTQNLLDNDAGRNSSNTLLRQSSGIHKYGSTDCAMEEPLVKENRSPRLIRRFSSVIEPDPIAIRSIRGLLALCALSIHSAIEGLAIGLQKTTEAVFFLFGAVSAHKFVIAFCLGMEMATPRSHQPSANTCYHAIYMGTFAFLSVVGIATGLFLTDPDSSSDSVAVLVLQGLAAGTLLYVTFFEILPRERAKCHAGLLQFVAVAAGFGLMLALESLVSHEHGVQPDPTNQTMGLKRGL